MIIKDNIYGEFEITEPVLIELLNSPFLHRLKNISNFGFYPGGYSEAQDKRINKYSHSIGVFLLLRKFNATLEEQIAGLIHDVSHSAFSHTIDHVFPEDKEYQKNNKSQDDVHEEFIMKTDIIDILKKYNIDLNYVLDDKIFTLKENELPDICADRIDYSLRQGVIQKYISDKEKDLILNGLEDYNQSFCFNNIDSAKLFTESFWEQNLRGWTNIKSAIMFCYNGKLLKKMVDKGYISKEDLFSKDDKEIIDLFYEKAKEDKDIKEALDILELPVEAFDATQTPESDHLYLKVRNVNPNVLIDGELKRYGDICKEYGERYNKSPKYKEYYLSVKK